MLSFIVASLAASNAYSHPLSTWSSSHHRDRRRGYLYRRGGSSSDGNLGIYEEETQNNGTNSTAASSVLSSLTGGQPLLYSICSVTGERPYQEDEYFVERGRFAALFDGHGGSSVSQYLRQNLYANFQAALPTSTQTDQSSIIASALETAFDKVDNEVGSISHWSFTGSTAVAVMIHELNDATRSIVTANVGDSRAVLSRNRIAIDLTKDHKPNDSVERERIEGLGGTVDWCGEVDSRGFPKENTGVYRINGNLALSRAIGDRSERPWVTNAVDIKHYLIDEGEDSFVILATDGLWDVMTSQEVIMFIHEMMDSTPPVHRHELQRSIAKYVVDEALLRGSSDNITVLVLWINEEN